MVLNKALYFRRRLSNLVFIALSMGAAVFGLVWLGFILFALFKNGFSAMSVSLFTQITPPPGDPDAREPRPAGLTRLDTDGHGKPVDPEDCPASEDDNVDDRHQNDSDAHRTTTPGNAACP